MWVTLLAALLVWLGSTTASAAPSDTDPSFGEDGYTAVQTNENCLRVCVEFGGSYADALVLQPDGGIVLGGYNDYIGAPDFSDATFAPGAIVRLLPDGMLDTSFGSEGIDELPFGVGALQTDAIGGLLVLGETEGGRRGAERFTASGVLDGQYGPGGVRWLPSFEDQRDRAGRFVGLVSVHVPASDYKGATTHLDLTRRLPSGVLDTHFGHRGYAPLPGSEEVESATLMLAGDGSAIVAFQPYSRTEKPRPSRMLLERFTPNGKQLDPAFGRDGLARSPIPTLYGGGTLAMAPDGNILLLLTPRAQRANWSAGELALTEYTPTGHLDRRFGAGGIARSQLPGERVRRFTDVDPRAITFDGAGNAIVVGTHRIQTVDTPRGNGFIARYTPNGRDCSFGDDGVLVDEHFGGISAVAVQPNGGILVAGWGSGTRFLAARYLGGSARTCPTEAKR